MIAGADAMSREQMKRIYGCIRVILRQIKTTFSKQDVELFKTYIKVTACSEGYPYKFEHGKIYPKSLAQCTQAEGNIINIIINRYADENELYLYESDEYGLFPSVGGRTRQEMIRDYPSIYSNELEYIKNFV